MYNLTICTTTSRVHKLNQSLFKPDKTGFYWFALDIVCTLVSIYLAQAPSLLDPKFFGLLPLCSNVQCTPLPRIQRLSCFLKQYLSSLPYIAGSFMAKLASKGPGRGCQALEKLEGRSVATTFRRAAFNCCCQRNPAVL